MVRLSILILGVLILVHSHMLRNYTGFKLTNDGQDTRSIQHYLGQKKYSKYGTEIFEVPCYKPF
ncbi:TPA: hypothetical protein F8T52_09195 [Legionella pneumophila]|nr:hypothetical protein [Legionella pneumophila]